MSNYEDRRDVRPVRTGRRVVVKRQTGLEWLPIAIILLILVIGGVIVWLLMSDNNNDVMGVVATPLLMLSERRRFAADPSTR